jgi:hypothetical protein
VMRAQEERWIASFQKNTPWFTKNTTSS